MQTFVIKLSKPISLAALKDKWANEPTGYLRVDFELEDATLSAIVHSGELTSWPSQEFCRFIRIVIHKVDRKCDVVKCEEGY